MYSRAGSSKSGYQGVTDYEGFGATPRGGFGKSQDLKYL